MATDVFKGGIKIGAISVTFMSDFSNIDSDLLVASYADVDGGNVQTPHEAIAPGGSATVRVDALKKGLLEVLVVTGHEEESGRLQVAHDGNLRDDEPTKGPIRWVYAVHE